MSPLEGEGRKRYEHPKMVVSQRMKKKVERGWVGCEKWDSLQKGGGGEVGTGFWN